MVIPPRFHAHRQGEGFSWILKGKNGAIIARSEKIYSRRESALKACVGIKKMIAEAEISRPKGDRPAWAATL